MGEGRGDGVALRGTTRRWSFHGPGRGRRPSAFRCGNHFVPQMKAEFPTGASAKRGAVPAPNPGLHPKNQDRRDEEEEKFMARADWGQLKTGGEMDCLRMTGQGWGKMRGEYP